MCWPAFQDETHDHGQLILDNGSVRSCPGLGDSTATGADDQRLFYHHNALGSVYALADTMAGILETYQYDAYGRSTVFDPARAALWFSELVTSSRPAERASSTAHSCSPG